MTSLVAFSPFTRHSGMCGFVRRGATRPERVLVDSHTRLAFAYTLLWVSAASVTSRPKNQAMATKAKDQNSG